MMFKQYTFILPYKSPLNWQVLLSFFRMHQIIGVEKITENIYQRTFQIDKATGFLSVTHQQPNLILDILTSSATVIPVVERTVRQMFDLDLDQTIFKQWSNHQLLGDIYAKYPMLRIPGGFDVFETAVNTILSQLISVNAARKILAKLVARYGKEIIHPISKEIYYLFPTAIMLADADLTEIGMTRIKIKAIKELASKVKNGDINLKNNDTEELKNDLLKVPGIGPWTTEYIALRCFDKNAFPKNDLILARYLKNYPELKQFNNWRSYLALYLWQHHLSSKEKI